MAVFEVGDNELPRQMGYLGWGEKIGTPTILDSDCRSESKHRIQNLSFVVFVTVQKFLLFGLSVIENPKKKSKIQNSFDHPIHPIQHRLRDCQADLLRGLEIDY